MAGTVAQYPYEMAYIVVESGIKVMEGRPIPTYFDAPIKLLTAEDLK
jgi:ABC-type sugar transport system substrate-binding protein